MITFSNGCSFEYFVASGALAFDGKGWPWERPLVKLGLIQPKLFAVAIKSLTAEPTKGNLKLYKFWTCIRRIPGGAVNKVGLTNPGFDWWEEKVGPKVRRNGIPIVGSIFSTKILDLINMATRLNRFPLVALEVNYSCPNTGHGPSQADAIINGMIKVKRASIHPLILKLAVNQDYVAIAKGLRGVVEAISFNTVPWSKVFPNQRSPLYRLDTPESPGAGGVSGVPAQKHTWPAIREIKREVPDMNVIGPHIMEYEDMERVRQYGADAVSFGAIHIRTPWKPTEFVLRERLQSRIKEAK